MIPPALRILRLPDGSGLPLPAYRTAGAAGLDLAAALPADQPVIIEPGNRRLIGTGLAVALPPGHEGQIRPRSGLAFEHGVTVLNAPGTIDEDYRGEIKILLVNHGDAPVTIRRGMRIAQLVIAPVVQADVTEVANLEDTGRGADGFGSTGTV